MQMPPLRYLSAADVREAMPGIDERLELARPLQEHLAYLRQVLGGEQA